MNNPLSLKVKYFPGMLPEGVIIGSDELQQRNDYIIAAEKILDEAKNKADQAIIEVERTLDIAKKEAKTLLDIAHSEVEAIKTEARNNAIDDTVVWLCDSIDIERKIARNINLRWRSYTTQILHELLENTDINQLMLRKLERKVEGLLLAGTVKLHVPESVFEKISQQWANKPEIIVLNDPALTDGKAILDSGLVRIYIDIPEHHSKILAQLNTHSVGEING